MAEHLPSNHKTLGSILNTPQNNNNKESPRGCANSKADSHPVRRTGCLPGSSSSQARELRMLVWSLARGLGFMSFKL